MWISSVEFRIHYDIYYPLLLKSLVSTKNNKDNIGYFMVYKSSRDYPEKLREEVCVNPEDGTR